MLALELRRSRLEGQRLRRQKRLADYFKRLGRVHASTDYDVPSALKLVKESWWQRLINWIKQWI